jgi:hypothetical protein
MKQDLSGVTGGSGDSTCATQGGPLRYVPHGCMFAGSVQRLGPGPGFCIMQARTWSLQVLQGVCSASDQLDAVQL